jgi:hypothetical protein
MHLCLPAVVDKHSGTPVYVSTAAVSLIWVQHGMMGKCMACMHVDGMSESF